MANLTIHRVCDLGKMVTPERLNGNLYTGEGNAHRFEIECREDGLFKALTGSVTGRFLRPNNSTILLSGSVENGIAAVTLQPDCYNYNGPCGIVIYSVDDDVVTVIYAAVGNVSRGQVGTLIDSGEAVPSVDTYIANYKLTMAALAEVADLRNGLSGTLYGKAGDAVRTELANVRDTLNAQKVNAPAQDGTAGQVLATLGDGVTQWTTVGQPTDAQTLDALNAYLEAHPGALDVEHRGWVTPEMFGAVGDGTTDDSTAVQAAVNSGYNVRFLRKVYRFKQVTISDDIIIEGVGATLKPLAYSAASNQFVNMFISTDADVTMRNLKFLGLGAALTQTTDYQSLIAVNGGNIRLQNCEFSDISTKNQAVAGTDNWTRFANVLFAVGCVDVAEITGCKFTDIGGEEILSVMPGAETPLVGRCTFANNVVQDVEGYSFNLYAKHLDILSNTVDGFEFWDSTRFGPTLFNCHALHAWISGNVITNTDARDIFDFCEGPGQFRGYSVRIEDNYADTQGSVFAACCGEKVYLHRNYVVGGALYQGYDYNSIATGNAPAMYNDSILDASLVSIADNVFILRSVTRSGETLPIRAIVEPYNAGLWASINYADRTQLKHCEIRNNVIRTESGSEDAQYPTFTLDTMIAECDVLKNIVFNPGFSGGLRSPYPRVFTRCNAAFNHSIKRLRIDGNSIYCTDTDSRLEFLVGIVTPGSGQSEYGFDPANTYLIEDYDAGYNSVDRSYVPLMLYGTTPPRIFRKNAFTLTPAVSTSLITGTGMLSRATNSVRLYMRIHGSTNVGAGPLFVVPEAYRPQSNHTLLPGVISMTAAGEMLAATMQVTTDGNVSVTGGETGNLARLSGCIEYTLD